MPSSPVGSSDRQLAKRVRPLSAGLSIAAHLAVVVAIISARPEPVKDYVERVMSVTMVEETPPADPLTPPSPPKPSPAANPPRKSSFRETPAPVPPEVEPMPAGKDKTTSAGVELSDQELSGAATAGTSPSGGGCNMPRRLQNALRKDPLVLAAVAQADQGKAIVVWNGDWVRRPDQEGHGLAAVREALMWEIGFAPEACRAQAVHGLVLLSLNDGPGAARLVVGAGDWRWSDLLFSRSTAGGRGGGASFAAR